MDFKSPVRSRVRRTSGFGRPCRSAPKVASRYQWVVGRGGTTADERPVAVGDIEDPDIRAAMETFERNKDEQSLREFVRPFAERFQVSLIAGASGLKSSGG